MSLKFQLEAICSGFLDTFDSINSDIHCKLQTKSILLKVSNLCLLFCSALGLSLPSF